MRPAKCPRCGRKLRMKPGTKRTTPGDKLRFQCESCLATHPGNCEWHPAMVEMFAGMTANGETPDLD